MRSPAAPTNTEIALGLRVLDLFTATPPPLIIYPKDVASDIGANPAAAYRVCEQLAESGWLVACRQTRTISYRLGPKASLLGARAIDGAMREYDLALETLHAAGHVLRECARGRDAAAAAAAQAESSLASSSASQAQEAAA